MLFGCFLFLGAVMREAGSPVTAGGEAAEANAAPQRRAAEERRAAVRPPAPR